MARNNRISTGNLQTTTRVFRGTSTSFMQVQNQSQGGVQAFFAVTSAVSDYVGSNFVSNNFEQYKVLRVKVSMKPSATALNNGLAPTTTQESILYQNSVYSLCNQTEVQSFIDYDTDVNPTYPEILSRPNMTKRALAPNAWTVVANFVPRTLTNTSNTGVAPSNNFNTSTWMSTNQMNAKLYGYRGCVSNRAPVFDTQDNVAAVDFMLQITVAMRGPKNSPSDLTFRVLDHNCPPTPSPLPRNDDETLEEEESK